MRINVIFRQHVYINSLRPRQNGRLFADDTFKCIFLNENIRILTKNSLKFVPKGLINNIQALVLIMAWRRPGDKPLSEPMLVKSVTHIYVTRPQYVEIAPKTLSQYKDFPGIGFSIIKIRRTCDQLIFSNGDCYSYKISSLYWVSLQILSKIRSNVPLSCFNMLQ